MCMTEDARTLPGPLMTADAKVNKEVTVAFMINKLDFFAKRTF